MLRRSAAPIRGGHCHHTLILTPSLEKLQKERKEERNKERKNERREERKRHLGNEEKTKQESE